MVDSWLPTVLHARHFVRVITSPFIPPLSTSNAGNLLQGRGGNFKGREGKDWRGTFVSAEACHSPFRSKIKIIERRCCCIEKVGRRKDDSLRSSRASDFQTFLPPPSYSSSFID